MCTQCHGVLVHRNSLTLAKERGLKTVAFPAISCGVYGYPVHDAAQVTLLSRSSDRYAHIQPY